MNTKSSIAKTFRSSLISLVIVLVAVTALLYVALTPVTAQAPAAAHPHAVISHDPPYIVATQTSRKGR